MLILTNRSWLFSKKFLDNSQAKFFSYKRLFLTQISLYFECEILILLTFFKIFYCLIFVKTKINCVFCPKGNIICMNNIVLAMSLFVCPEEIFTPLNRYIKKFEKIFLSTRGIDQHRIIEHVRTLFHVCIWIIMSSEDILVNYLYKTG